MNDQDLDKILGAIGLAKKAALNTILEKVREKKPLTADDRKYLLQYEEELKVQGEESAPADYQGKTEFANALEVTEYLQAEGWKIKKSTVYAHIKKGKLRPDAENGRFSIKAVHKYASSFLTLEETRQKVQDEDLQRQKLQAEISRIKEQSKRERIKRLAEEGRLIPRDQFELELAARASVIDTLRRNSIQTLAAERVALVGGDPGRIPDLIAFDMAQHDDEMNQFATTREFHVLFEKTTTEEDPPQSRGDVEEVEP